MIARAALGSLLRVLPKEWKCRLGIHLGVPHLRWSLLQLRNFGFAPGNVLDVGAYRGDWARRCLQFFPRAHITCVEPQDALQPVLRQLAHEFPNIDLIQTVLGRQVLQSVPFEERGSGSSVLTSSVNPSASKPMTTIDQLIDSGRCPPPEFLKLDVQGYEIEVMEGWVERFDACEVIQCEISLLPIVLGAPLLSELVAYLDRRGFVMFDVTELIRSPSDGAVWQIDALFCRKDSPLRTARTWDRDSSGELDLASNVQRLTSNA